MVLRNYLEYAMEDGSFLWKNIICKAEDAVLLPINERKWRVPRAARDKFGFGRSNVWYADYEQSEKVKPCSGQRNGRSGGPLMQQPVSRLRKALSTLRIRDWW